MKRKIAIVLVIALLSTGLVYAASVNGTFAGLPIVNVKVNGETLKTEVPGVVLQGKTLLPARAIAESLDSAVSWDQATMTASITKPVVNMMFINEVEENQEDSWDLLSPYGVAPIGYNTIIVFYDIGPMSKQLYEYRIAVVDPDGETVALESDSFEIDSYGMSGFLIFDSVNFSKPGNYVFKFQMRLNGEYQTIGRKILVLE